MSRKPRYHPERDFWHTTSSTTNSGALLSSACPNLKVTLITSKNLPNRYRFSTFFVRKCLITANCDLPHPIHADSTLNLLVTNYHRTLGIVDSHVKNENETLDDIPMMMLRRCSKLKSFVFNGYGESASTEDLFLQHHILNEEIEDTKHKRVQFALMLQSQRNLFLLILN
ncbi:hypothetical protein MTP99_013236 [Tenebrio molitor]|nr:hypothetical protein MTP99_013236 [Tenebrio molitor]